MKKCYIYVCVCVCVCMCLYESENEVAQLCTTLWDTMDCSVPGSSLHGIFQTRILDWVAISFSWGLPDPGIKSVSSALADVFFTSDPPVKPTGQLTSVEK